MNECVQETSGSTDLRKKVKDIWVSWNDYVQKWSGLNGKGVDIITAISNTKLKASAGLDSSTADGSLNKDGYEVVNLETLTQLQACCTELLDVYNSMTVLVTKMERLTAGLKAVAEFEQHRYGCLHVECPVRLFDACSNEKFYESSKILLSQYKKDLEVKGTIVEHVALTTDRNTLMRYLVTWMCQPYILDSSKVLLQAMLVAAGLYT